MTWGAKFKLVLLGIGNGFQIHLLPVQDTRDKGT